MTMCKMKGCRRKNNDNLFCEGCWWKVGKSLKKHVKKQGD